jgi:protein ImuB
LLDVTSSAARLGGEQQLALNVYESFEQRGYATRIAIAETIGAAWALTHFDDEHQDATADAPLYPLVVPSGEAPVELGPLPIESLRLEQPTVDLLHQLGVRTNAQLMELPRDGLKSRFGPKLLERIDQAIGRVAETFTFHHVTLPLQVQMSLEYPTHKRKVLEECISRLLTGLCEQLREQGRGALGVDCCLTLMDRSSFTMHVGLFHPSWELSHLNQLLKMQLDQRSIPDKVQRVVLSVSVSTRLEQRQTGLPGDLAEELSGAASQQLAYLVDRMSNRLGRDTVVGARLLAEPNIEGAFRYRPLTGQRTAPLKSTAAAERKHLLKSGLRPLHVTRPPVRLHIQNGTTNQPPRSFGYAGQQRITQRFWGPERIETGWWSGRMIRRDYYQVEDHTGNRFWLFLDLNQHEWYLHGLF